MRKVCTILMMALMCAVVTNAKTVYLNTGGSSLWGKDAPAFFVHSWSSETDYADAQMTLVNGDIYSAEVNDGHGNIIFVRMPSGSTSLDWSKKWDQTGNLSIPNDKNMYTITGWGDKDGNWSTYSGGSEGEGGGGDDGGDGQVEKGVWYYKGNIDGQDVEPNDATKFTKGVVEFSCTKKSYLMVLYQEDGVPGVQYMAETYVNGGDNCVLKNTTTANKWGIEPYMGNLYLYYGDDATQVILSKVEIPGKTLVGGGSDGGSDGGDGEEGDKDDEKDEQDALNEIMVEGKALKYIQNGQLWIQRGDKVVDAFGRELKK